MSDSFQSLAFPDVLASDAEAVGARLLAYLVERGVVVLPASADCVLGGEGYRPGPRAREAVENGASLVHGGLTDGEAPAAMPSGEDELGKTLERVTNGVEVITERTVFHTGGNGLEMTCGRCGAEGIDPESDAWDEAVGAWFEGDDGAPFACPACGESTRLVDWSGPFAFGFGCVGLTFWNWPVLAEAFVRDVEAKAGSRARRVRGHL